MPSRERTFWKGLPRSEVRPMRAFYRALEARYGPFDLVAKEYGRLTTEAWWSAVGASRAALVEAAKRRDGRGRRPTQQAVDRRLKRQGLGIGSFDQLVRRLEELAKARKGDLAEVFGRDAR